MRTLGYGALLVCWLSVCGTAGGVMYPAPARAAAEHTGLSMDDAVRMAEARFHARVIKAQTQREGARTVYVLRLLNDSTGRVWTVHVDAANGMII